MWTHDDTWPSMSLFLLPFVLSCTPEFHKMTWCALASRLDLFAVAGVCSSIKGRHISNSTPAIDRTLQLHFLVHSSPPPRSTKLPPSPCLASREGQWHPNTIWKQFKYTLLHGYTNRQYVYIYIYWLYIWLYMYIDYIYIYVYWYVLIIYIYIYWWYIYIYIYWLYLTIFILQSYCYMLWYPVVILSHAVTCCDRLALLWRAAALWPPLCMEPQAFFGLRQSAQHTTICRPFRSF